MILHEKKKNTLQEKDPSLYEILIKSKEKNKQILEMKSKVESETLQKNIKEIYDTSEKIINTVEKEPKKYKKMSNFFGYYLPVTLNILKKYDEIENQNLTTKEGKQFLAQTEKMIAKINNAFKNQLSNLYQTDMIDTDAEIKVFDSMLKADGYDTSNDFQNEVQKLQEKEGKN